MTIYLVIELVWPASAHIAVYKKMYADAVKPSYKADYNNVID